MLTVVGNDVPSMPAYGKAHRRAILGRVTRGVASISGEEKVQKTGLQTGQGYTYIHMPRQRGNNTDQGLGFRV